MLKKNGIHRVKIIDLNNLGFGVAKIEGMTVFIGGAVDGDELDARIILVHKTYAVARIEKLITPSAHRINAPACHRTACGGCAYQGIIYAHEKMLKESYVRHAFLKAGLKDVTVLPVLSTDQTAGYRNKAQYAVSADQNGRCIAGFFAPKTHRIVEAVDCPLADAAFPPIVKSVIDFANQNGILPYDEKTGKGTLRHIYLRASSVGGVLLTLVINQSALACEKELVSLLSEKHKNIVGIYLNINTESTNVICSDEYRHLWGERCLTDVLAGVPLSLSPASFYQVNHAAAEMLYAHAADLAAFSADDDLLDLYCGVGSIGLSMARQVKSLVGVEIVPSAVECAKENAKKMGLSNARFFCADAGRVEELIASLQNENGTPYRPTAVVLDPPRKGCDEALLSFLANELRISRILYISCNPDTLARDARILSDYGYSLGAVTPVDLFPRTGHVESVVCLTRRLDN